MPRLHDALKAGPVATVPDIAYSAYLAIVNGEAIREQLPRGGD